MQKLEKYFRKMLWNMWLIIVSLTIVNFYGYVYSQAIFFAPKGNCDFEQISTFVLNFNNIVERFTTYVLWTLPIVYVFWPADRTWYGRQIEIKRRGSSTNSNSSKTYYPLNASQRFGSTTTGRTSVNKDDSSSSDDDYRDNRISSVAENMPLVYAGGTQTTTAPTMFQLKNQSSKMSNTGQDPDSSFFNEFRMDGLTNPPKEEFEVSIGGAHPFSKDISQHNDFDRSRDEDRDSFAYFSSGL